MVADSYKAAAGDEKLPGKIVTYKQFLTLVTTWLGPILTIKPKTIVGFKFPALGLKFNNLFAFEPGGCELPFLSFLSINWRARLVPAAGV